MVSNIIRVNGLKEVTNFLRKLPSSIREEVSEKGMDTLATSLQRRIKWRSKSKGWLRRSVMVDKNGKFRTVSINAFYAMAVEKGRKNKLVIPIEYIEQHKTMPDAPAQRVTNVKRWVKLSGKKRPFIKPALDSLRKDIPNMLGNFADKAIKSAGR